MLGGTDREETNTMKMLTDTATCNMMNKVYETMKPLTIAQIAQMRDVAIATMPPAHGALLAHQCKFAILKKRAGAWA